MTRPPRQRSMTMSLHRDKNGNEPFQYKAFVRFRLCTQLHNPDPRSNVTIHYSPSTTISFLPNQTHRRRTVLAILMRKDPYTNTERKMPSKSQQSEKQRHESSGSQTSVCPNCETSLVAGQRCQVCVGMAYAFGDTMRQILEEADNSGHDKADKAKGQ